MRQAGAKTTDTRTQAKRMESALTIVVHLLLQLKKFLSGQRQRFQKEREAETSVTQFFQSLAADLYDTGMQKLIPRYENVSILIFPLNRVLFL